MIANINNPSRIKLPSISELTKSTDIKLPSIAASPSHSPSSPNYNYGYNYTHQRYQMPVPSSHQVAVGSGAPVAVSPPPLPGQGHSPQPPQRLYQLPPYYPVYYHQQTQLPSPPANYMVPEVINKPINKCHRCGTTETLEWRRGPNGVRTLCNACGLYHAKLVKRKGAAVAAQEVLNNKVCKGKNGRRITIKKNLITNKMNMKMINKVV